MNWLCNTLGAGNKQIPHVSFTESTLQLERERQLKRIASPVPFENYLNELRLKALDDSGQQRMLPSKSQEIRKQAIEMWPLLSAAEKNKFQQLAQNSNKTRIKMLYISKSKSSINLAKQAKPKRSLKRKRSSAKIAKPAKLPKCNSAVSVDQSVEAILTAYQQQVQSL